MFGSDTVEPLKFQITEVSGDMSNADYHSRDEISSSFVKTTHKHSIGRMLAPQPEEIPHAFIFGDAFHGAMELGDIDWERFVVKPEGMKFTTREGKAWREENSHKHILTQREVDSIQGMVDSVYDNPFFKPYKESKKLKQRDEWSYFADGDCQYTKGMRFRIRPDVLFERGSGGVEIIFDYKSCIEIAKLTRWQFFDFGYDIQAVFYADVLGVDPKKFVFLAVEKEQPWSSRAIRLTNDSIDSARLKLRAALERISLWQSDPNKREYKDITLPDLIEL